MRRSLVILSGLMKSMTKMVTGCLRPTKVTICAVYLYKCLFCKMCTYKRSTRGHPWERDNLTLRDGAKTKPE